MPNTIQSLIIVIAFLAPGFYLVIRMRKKMPLFYAKTSQFESIILLCLLGLIPPAILVMSASIATLLFSAICRSSEPLLDFLSYAIAKGKISIAGKETNIIPQKLQDLQIWQIISFIAYTFLSVGIAHVVEFCFSRWAREKPGRVDQGSAWLDAFSRDRSNLVSALLDNGYTVIGEVSSVQTDVEALISGKRDLVLESVTIVEPDGHYQADKITELVIINSRDIKILEFTTEPIDNNDTTEEGENHDTEKTD